MNRIMTSMRMRFTVRHLYWAACALSLVVQAFSAGPGAAATTLPVLWTAGGHSAGADSAGQAARMAVDRSGNVTVVSGPGFYTAMVVTSYTSTGTLRWQRTVAPLSGTMSANWVAAAPNGDVVALGSTADSHGNAYAITLVRFGSDGALRWRIDPPVTIFRSSVGRLVVDEAGSTYVTYNNAVAKYSASGVLVWTNTIPAGFTTSLALGPDGSDAVVTGNFWGSFNSVIGSFNATTGASRWVATGVETSNDVVVGSGRVYVTGQSYTGAGTPALAYFLTVVSYDRATGARQWRTDSSPGSLAMAVGQRIALAPDGGLVATGYTSPGGYTDWWTVAVEADGVIRWQVLRDRAPYPDEMPSVVFVLADGTTVVSGLGGPLQGPTPTGMSYPQGVTAGYSPSGTLLWEGFSTLPTVWAAALPSGDVCATGGYDAFITCFQVPGAANFQPVLTATPLSGPAPLTVDFTRSVTTDPNGTLISFVTLEYGDSAPGTSGTLDFGDGTQTFALNKTSSHTYNTAGTYTARLTVFYSNGASVSRTASIAVSPSVTPARPPLITASPASGTVPLTVTLTNSAASNPPLISSYTVDYGDGASDQFILNAGDGVPAFNSSISHTYTAAGTYNATLTVFYADATNASDTVSITVNPVATKTMRSTAINLSATLQRNKVNAIGTVVVRSNDGAAVPGAVVSTTWNRPGGTTLTQTATTNSTGSAKFSTGGGRGTYTLTVDGVSKTGYSFDKANSVLSKSVTK
ncbi:MAG: PKD domain-containing protein [Deltaproteobacteria bacterium]|nr:PKD domain-containing protein [Deltaproteobacteria bacterium]